MTLRTKVSPSQQYQHLPRQTAAHAKADFETDHGRNRNNHHRRDSETESEDGGMFESTLLRKSYEERAASNSEITEIERKLDLWSRQLNSNIIVWL